MAGKSKNILGLFLAIQKKHLKSAFISKSDAFVNVFMMIINNLSFAFMWWVLFRNRGTINGWSFDDMLLVFAVTCNGFWLFATFFRGIEQIPVFIENGNLDSYLSSPRSPLFMLSTSLSTFANWGDLITGYLAFFLSSYVSLGNFLWVTVLSFYVFSVLYGFRLIASSLSFYASNTERLGHNIYMAMLIFMHQPASIFTGWYKVMFLTIIPAGYMTLFPINIIKSFSWEDFLYLNLGCLCILSIGIFMFKNGLKKYSSGNRFGIR